MCVSFCSRQGLLFWNHGDCNRLFCPVVGKPHGTCQTCQYRFNDTCHLTNASLPGSGGCCHWNVLIVDGSVQITPKMVAPLAGSFDTVRNVLAKDKHQVIDGSWNIPHNRIELLKALGIQYQASETGLLVDPDQLVLTIDEPITDVLDRLDVPYQIEPETEQVLVDLSRLQMPLTFGLGVDW